MSTSKAFTHAHSETIRKGILSIERLYAPAAAGIILKSRGGNQQ